MTSKEFLTQYCLPPFECPDMHQVQPEGHGSVFHEEGQILAGLARRLGGPILEIGACLAISTEYILHGMEPTDELLTLDLNHQRYLKDPRVQQISANSFTWRKPLKFKWVFVDGDHRKFGVLADIETCLAHGIEIMLFHDTSRRFEAEPITMSDGSRAREAVFERLADWNIVEIDSPCGMLYVTR